MTMIGNIPKSEVLSGPERRGHLGLSFGHHLSNSTTCSIRRRVSMDFEPAPRLLWAITRQTLAHNLS